jgi:DNA-binding MarR family transcriptional regulator
VSAARERRTGGDAVDAASPPRADPAPAHGIDQACLAHLLGYQLSLADIPAKRVFFRHIGEPLGLRPVEFTILILAAFNPSATQKQLAQALALSAPNTTILLDRLAERGLIERVRSTADRRAQHIHLTPAGRKLARAAHEVSRTMEQDLLRHLSDGERALLLELLHKVGRHRRV